MGRTTVFFTSPSLQFSVNSGICCCCCCPGRPGWFAAAAAAAAVCCCCGVSRVFLRFNAPERSDEPPRPATPAPAPRLDAF